MPSRLPPERIDRAIVSGVRYALHFDAALVARYLRAYAAHLGVTCLDRTVATATLGDDAVESLRFVQLSVMGE